MINKNYSSSRYSSIGKNRLHSLLRREFPKRSKNNDQDADIVTTSPYSDRLVTQDSCDFSRLASVGNQLLSGQCYSILTAEDIKEAVAGKEQELVWRR